MGPVRAVPSRMIGVWIFCGFGIRLAVVFEVGGVGVQVQKEKKTERPCATAKRLKR